MLFLVNVLVSSVCKMNSVISKSNIETEFQEIDSKGGWAHLYQVRYVFHYYSFSGFSGFLIEVQGQRISF